MAKLGPASIEHPLRHIRLYPFRIPHRYLSTPSEERKTASFYISNVFPVRLTYWDPRPTWASLREEALMERLHDITSEITGHSFRVEAWEITRKDGGVFLHFSYMPPKDEEEVEKDLSSISSIPEVVVPTSLSPGRLFLPQLMDSAKRKGGFPSWLGQWWANRWEGRHGIGTPGHRLYTSGLRRDESDRDVRENGMTNMTSDNIPRTGMTGIQAIAGGGRVWVVKGRQWTEVSEQHMLISVGVLLIFG